MSKKNQPEQKYGYGARKTSRADADLNWRETPAMDSENRRKNFHSGRLQNVINGRDSFHIPYYNNIQEDDNIFKTFRSSRKYVGDYSEDSEGKFSEDKVRFHFLNKEFAPDGHSKMKEVKLDLKVAIEKGEDYTNQMFAQNFFIWISSRPDVLSSLINAPNAARNEPTFVARSPTWEHILQVPMPYCRNRLLFFCAIYISGTIYVELMLPLEIKDRLLEKYTEGPEAHVLRSRLPEYFHQWAHKYEQYMCGEDVTKGTVPNEQFRIVVSSKLGPYKMMSMSPIDAVNSDIYNGERNLKNFVKLCCTSCEYSDDPKHYINGVKSFKWLLPMLTAGTDEMIAGFCGQDGVVPQVRLYTVDDILEKGKENFNINKNFTFAVKLLDFVKKNTKLDPGKVFYFQKLPGTNIVTCEKVDSKVLPDWFVEKLDSS